MKILGGHFDVLNKKRELESLESELNDGNIWEDAKKANALSLRVANIKKEIANYP
ncbi:MAG: hypothetical protein K2G03_03560 [Bacilli bacterium]|nr:hypothetical protein [Bacilli bacterium]